MKHKKVVRNVTVGALATGIVPLVGGGLDAAGAAGQSPAGLCTSTFGDHGPVGGSIVGEGPPGDPMTVTIGWEPGDWPDGLREVVTCVSIGGQAVPALTRSTPAPPNNGNLIVDLLLPPGTPGSLVCQQSILFGKGHTDGREHSTAAKCFKLRAAEELLAGPEAAGGSTVPSAGNASGHIPNTHPAYPPAGDVRALLPGGKAANAAPTPSISTPPARAAFEAARGAVKAPAAWSTPPARSSSSAAVAAPKPIVPVTRGGGQAANELARMAPANPRAGRTLSAAGVTAPRAATPATASHGAPGAPGSAARAALPRTGVGDRIPLAGAGGLLAIGGAAIILGEPRRRAARRLA